MRSLHSQPVRAAGRPRLLVRRPRRLRVAGGPRPVRGPGQSGGRSRRPRILAGPHAVPRRPDRRRGARRPHDRHLGPRPQREWLVRSHQPRPDRRDTPPERPGPGGPGSPAARLLRRQHARGTRRRSARRHARRQLAVRCLAGLPPPRATGQVPRYRLRGPRGAVDDPRVAVRDARQRAVRGPVLLRLLRVAGHRGGGHRLPLQGPGAQSRRLVGVGLLTHRTPQPGSGPAAVPALPAPRRDRSGGRRAVATRRRPRSAAQADAGAVPRPHRGREPRRPGTCPVVGHGGHRARDRRHPLAPAPGMGRPRPTPSDRLQPVRLRHGRRGLLPVGRLVAGRRDDRRRAPGVERGARGTGNRIPARRTDERARDRCGDRRGLYGAERLGGAGADAGGERSRRSRRGEPMPSTTSYRSGTRRSARTPPPRASTRTDHR